MSAPVQEGDVLEGKYRVERVLGIGGMGVVVQATHIHLDQRVALKFLLPQALANADVVARFAREARAAARIQSEHVARVIDVSTMQNGAPYMVMEFLDGADLADTLRTRGAFSAPDAVDYLLEACEAIAEAHAAGIVHRDLKPGNLFLARRPGGGHVVKVLDFGISKTTTGPDASMTRTTAVMGSPLYMSPEQLKSSRDVDARSDVWAIGVILHELLTGSVPFQAETMPQLCAMILSEPPPPLRQVLPNASPGLEAIIQRCLQQDASRRFQNVAELAAVMAPYGTSKSQASAEKIGRVLADAGVLSTTPPVAVSHRPPAGASTNTSWGQQSAGSMVHGETALADAPMLAAKSRGPRTSLVVAGLTLVGLVVGAGVLAMRQGSSASAAPVPAVVAADSIQIVIRAKPENAKLFLDDAEVGASPYTVRMRKDATGHKVRVEAPGHTTAHRLVVFERDLELEISLEKANDAEGSDGKPEEGKGDAKAEAKDAGGPAKSGAAAPTPTGKRKLYDNPW